MMRYILFFSVCLFQLCFAEENVEKEIKHKKALEKIENLITNTQNQPRPNNNQTQSNSANRNYSQEQAESPPPENEQTYPENVSENTYSFKKAFYKTISILFGVIILVFVCIWLFRKFGGTKFQSSNSLRTIKIIEKRPISPKSILYLIEIGGQRILISESQFEVRRISELEWLDNTKQGL